MRFDNNAEELFYDFLNDFELTSMIKKIESQVWLLDNKVRVDFLLTLTSGNRLCVEFDGAQHLTKNGIEKDKRRDKELNSLCISVIHVIAKEFFNIEYRRNIADKIEGMIELLSG